MEQTSNTQEILNNIKEKSKNITSFMTYIQYSPEKHNIIENLKEQYNINNDKLVLNLYYNNIKEYTIPKCSYCEKDRLYINGINFHNTCGSKECKTQSKKQTSLNKFGYTHYSKSDEYKNRIKNNSLKNYGVENVSQAPEIKEKRKRTTFKNYGVENVSQANIIKEKKKQKAIEHYGVENVSQSNIIKEKKKQKAIEHYGVENVSQVPEIKEKRKQTILERYGVEYVAQSDDIKEKTKQTNLKRYGTISPLQNQTILNKLKNTNLEKYGSEYYVNSKTGIHKIKESINNNTINKISNIIESNKLQIKLLNINTCLCKKCNNTFSINEPFIKERFRYYHNTICPYCHPKDFNQISNFEKEILIFIKELLPNEEIIENSRILGGKEIDIYIPSMKIGFECNGIYWHSELYKNKYYHRDKSKLASEKSIRLIHIWQDDWVYKNEIVKSRIKNLLGKTEKRVYGRNTEVKEISHQDCKQFLDENHIQGVGVGNIRYGLCFNNELVSVIQIDSSGQLSRFANKLNTNVIGGFSKLFKHCEKHIKYTFIDLDWSSENNIYSKYMKFDSYIEPTWYLIYGGRRIHRRNFQKKKLLQMGLGGSEQTEHEITLQNKLYRIYNSGNIKYVNKENGE